MAVSNFRVSFTEQSAVSIWGVSHGMGHKNLIVRVHDLGSAASYFTPARVQVNATSFGVIVSFGLSATGHLIINGYAAGMSGQANIGLSMTEASFMSWSGASHGVSTMALIFALYNDQTPAEAVEVGRLQVDATSYGIRLSNTVSHTGTLVLCGFTR